MTHDELLKKHPLYDRHEKTWKYLRSSYKGGKEYEEAKLLYQYAYERLDATKGAELYAERLAQTPFENHCKSAVTTYSSYIWRKKPQRDLGRLRTNYETLALLENCDLEGTPLNEFMRQVEIHGHIYGHSWIIVDKASKRYKTLAEERLAGARPYLIRYDPLDVWNWEFSRSESGQMELTYLKVCESETTRHGVMKQTIRIWTKDTIEAYTIIDGKIDLVPHINNKNHLGIIPAICHYSREKNGLGIGVSEIEDIAKMQQSIYNHLSEMTQAIRNENHNTLVKNRDDDTATGAGGVIIMAESTDPAKKPYLLQPQIFQLSGLISAIKEQTDMINRMSHLLPVRNNNTEAYSGEALKTEFQLLNALLNEMASQVQMTEQKTMKVFCRWIRKDKDFESITITYPVNFELRDTTSEIALLSQAKSLNVKSESYQKELDKAIVGLTMEDDAQLELITGEIDKATYNLETPTEPQQP